MDLFDDFDLFNNDIQVENSIDDYHKDIFNFPIFHSTPSLTRSTQPTRSFDYPSMKKHYGIVMFFDHQIPIIYRLINDSIYIPYIRFSCVLNIFEHSLDKNNFFDIRNLPVIEMTTIERVYYDELSSLSRSSDWSNYQLLSVSVLDGTLSIVNLIKNLKLNNNFESSKEWQETLNQIRQEARDRWMLDEKLVLTRLKEKEDTTSTSMALTNMAQRRSVLEERLDLSIIDEAGGFVQIDSYIYPYIKYRFNNQLYFNINDIRHSLVSPPAHMILYSDRNSSMFHTYNVVLEQANSNYEWNVIRRGRNHDLSKVLPSKNRTNEDLYEEIPFLPLQTLLHLISNNNSNSNVRFIQLFETSSLSEIDINYKNNLGQQFITGMKRQGGLVNSKIPCLIVSQFDRQILWIPCETKTERTMNNDERLYLNMILIYNGLWQNILTKKKQWFLKEIESYDKENLDLKLFSTTS